MSKEVLERVSIFIEVLAFFVAAPDFLGEAALAAITAKIERVIGLYGARLDEFAKRLLSKLSEFVASLGKSNDATSAVPPEPKNTNSAVPSGRLGFILFTIVLDTALVLSVQYQGMESLPALGLYLGGRFR